MMLQPYGDPRPISCCHCTATCCGCWPVGAIVVISGIDVGTAEYGPRPAGIRMAEAVSRKLVAGIAPPEPRAFLDRMREAPRSPRRSFRKGRQ